MDTQVESGSIWCAFCDFEIADGPDALERVRAHIAACPHHPQRKVERELEAAEQHALALIRQRTALESEVERLRKEAPTPMNAHEAHPDANLTVPPAAVASVPTVDAASALRERAERAEATNAIQAELGLRLTHERRIATERAALLEEERDWLKGEMEQFMRAASANHARVALLEGVLRSVEWATAENDEGEYEFCPSCRSFWDGHDSDCRLAAALVDGGG